MHISFDPEFPILGESSISKFIFVHNRFGSSMYVNAEWSIRYAFGLMKFEKICGLVNSIVPMLISWFW